MNEVRTLTIDGEPWFVGKDVAVILGYSNTNKAVQVHVDEEDKKILDFKGFSQNGNLPQRGIQNGDPLFILLPKFGERTRPLIPSRFATHFTGDIFVHRQAGVAKRDTSC